MYVLLVLMPHIEYVNVEMYILIKIMGNHTGHVHHKLHGPLLALLDLTYVFDIMGST